MKVSRSVSMPVNVHTALKSLAKGSVSDVIGRAVHEYIEQARAMGIDGVAKKPKSTITSFTIEHDDMVALTEIANRMGVPTNSLLAQIAEKEVEKRGLLQTH